MCGVALIETKFWWAEPLTKGTFFQSGRVGRFKGGQSSDFAMYIEVLIWENHLWTLVRSMPVLATKIHIEKVVQ